MGTNKQLREDDIRPPEIMKDHRKHVEADRKKLLTHKHKFVDVSCPACESKKANTKFIKNGFKYVTCAICETVFINPRQTAEILEKHYATSSTWDYWHKYIFPAADKVRRESLYKPRIEKIINLCKKYKLKNCVLMEVGAGYGSFCDEANKAGYFGRVIAVEPTRGGTESCRKMNVEVIEKPIEKVSVERGTVDLVVSFEVLEHLFSPKEFLMHCRKMLKPGGLIIIACPNVKGFDNSVLGELSTTFEYEHLNYFHPDSLALLMSNCGFRVVEKLTPGKLDADLVRNHVLKGDFSVENRPFLKRVLIDSWEETSENFQNFLADNLLSGHMWLVASNEGKLK